MNILRALLVINIVVIVDVNLLDIQKTVNDLKLPEIGVSPDSGVTVDQGNDSVTFGDPKCANCTKYINRQLESLRPAVDRLLGERVKIKFVKPCEECVISKLNNVSSYGDSCLNPVPNKPTQRETTFNLQWASVQLDCVCILPTDPTELMKTLQAMITIPKIPCGASGTVVALDSGTEGATDIVFKPQLSKLLSPDCVTSFLDIKLQNPISLDVVMTWNDVKVTGTARNDKTIKGPQGTSLVKGGMLERNYTNIHARCETASVGICKCLVETEIFVTLMEQMLELTVKCLLKNDDADFKSLLDSYLMCDY